MKSTSILRAIGVCAALAEATCPVANVGAIKHCGHAVGKEVVYEDLTLYVSGKKSDTAVLYLTDVYGIQDPLTQLLADSFGRAGYLTVAPDLFDGMPAPGDIGGSPDFNVTEFLLNHGPEVIDPIIDKAVDYIHGLGIDNIVATGYCFGGRHSFRVLAEGRGVSAAFAAHPSALEDADIDAIAGPISVAAAETDNLLPADRRHELEQILQDTAQPYSVALYSGTFHGFGIRANVSDPQQRFGKEEAFFQAVRWFDSWA